MFNFNCLYEQNKYLSTKDQHSENSNNNVFSSLQNNILGCLYIMKGIKAVLSLLLIVFKEAKPEVERKGYAVKVQMNLQTIHILW